VNLAGMDFGCVINGSCPGGFTPPPASQAGHFTALGMNLFRVPIGWQYLQPSGPGSTISSSIFQQYDAVVQNVFNANPSAKVIVEIHNYARYNGYIVGQDMGAPTNAQFADLWSQIAVNYQNNANIIFGLMNEPHNLNMSLWVVTLQTVINAIRTAGATTQVITLPGTNYEAGGGFPTASGIYLSSISDPVGGTNLLLYDVHQYLDFDYSGTHTTYVTDAVNGTFVPLAIYLRQNRRMVMLSETDGGSTPSCELYVASELAYLNANSDVFYGFAGWAAGSFSTGYALSMVPFTNGSDQGITAVFAAAIKKSSQNYSSNSVISNMARKQHIKVSLTQEALIVFIMGTIQSRIIHENILS
jgi:endoglucanase